MDCEKLKTDNGNIIRTNDTVLQEQKPGLANFKQLNKSEQILDSPPSVLIKRPNFFLRSFESYKKNLNELYEIYMKNDDYKNLISAIDNKLKTKNPTKAPTSLDNARNLRFFQKIAENPTKDTKSEFQYTKLLKPEGRHQIKEEFMTTLNSKSFSEGLKETAAKYKDSNFKSAYNEASGMNKELELLAEKDPKAKGLVDNVSNSVHRFVEKYRDEEQPEGILTVEGRFDKEPAKYIKGEEADLKNYNSEKVEMKDIQNVMDFKKYQ